MKYALMIYRDEEFFATEAGRQAMPELTAQHQAFAQRLGDRHVGGVRLKGSETATTVRVVNGGRTIHDGPFAEGREQLAGLYLIEADDLDTAIAEAREVPLSPNGAIEVRPLMEVG